MPTLSIFAHLFFELPCRMFPLVLAVGSASACDRLAVSGLDSVPVSEAESWTIVVSQIGAPGIWTGISLGSPSSCIATTSSSNTFILSMTTMYGKPRKPAMSTRST